MAGFIGLAVSDTYIGELTVNEANGVENGIFVKADFAAGTVAKVSSNAEGDGDVYFVCNEIDTVSEQGINDVDYVVKNGAFARIHYPQKGEILITTKYTGTPAKGAELAVGANGLVEAIGVRTPKIRFRVQDTTTAYGAAALKLVVL